MGAEVLKRGSARTVGVETAPDGTRVVVKSFRSANPLLRLRDRQRARHEFDVLSRLHARGVRVPRAVALRRRGSEVVMEWVPDTVTLYEAMAGAVPWPVAPGRLAAPLGRLLAGLHAAGVDHSDLHANNVLLDEHGEAWLIDFHAARLREALGPRELLRDLAIACAAGRQWFGRRFRARFLVAWWRALPSALRTRLPSLAAIAREVEVRGRLERRDVGRERARRWVRPSGACRVLTTDRGRAFENARFPAELLAAARAAAAAAADGETLPLAPELARACDASHARIRVGGASELRDRWLAAARLTEQLVPCLTPLFLTLSADARSARCAWALPAGARPFREAMAATDAPDRRRLAAALGALAGDLHDRALGLQPATDSLAELAWIDTAGRAALEPPTHLVDLAADALPAHAPEALGFTDAEHEEFTEAFLSAQRGGSGDAESLRAALGAPS